MIRFALFASLAPLCSGLPAVGTPAPTQPPCLQDDEPKKESAKERAARLEKEAKAAAATLREGLKLEEAGERRAALGEAAKTDHKIVVEAIAEALKDAEVDVRREALEQLGRMRDPSAVAACRAFARKERRALEKDTDTMVTLVRAVGRHADPKTTDWLLDGALEDDEMPLRRARLFAAARSRSPETLDAIFGRMKKIEERVLRGRFRQVRITLIWLTGQDQGENPSAWSAWWREHGKSFEVPALEPKLEASMAQEWAVFWGETRDYGGRKKRGDRG